MDNLLSEKELIEQLQNIILNEVDSLNRKWVPKEKFAERLAKKILVAQQGGEADGACEFCKKREQSDRYKFCARCGRKLAAGR